MDNMNAIEQQAEFESAMAFHMEQAFLSGQKAKRNGWFRVSPFCEDRMRDLYFFAGYDGMTWDELHGATN